jgi:CTD small phosphatase-like protein 2
MAGINIRPYAKEILKEMDKYYEVIVFTASHSCYANPVIDYLDPENKYVKARLFRYTLFIKIINRENCSQISQGVYTKDLRVIQNRNLEDLILVDNSTYSLILQLENGIPIIPFYNNNKDTVTKYILYNH